jgi:hypothetical protein
MNPTDRHPKELLSVWIDGALGAEERAEVDSHLAECPTCRKLTEELRLLSGAVAEEAVPPVPTGLADRIRWRVRGEARGRAPHAPFWRRAVPLTAAASLAAAGILVAVMVREGAFRGTGDPAVPPGIVEEQAIEAPAISALERPARDRAAEPTTRTEKPAEIAPSKAVPPDDAPAPAPPERWARPEPAAPPATEPLVPRPESETQERPASTVTPERTLVRKREAPGPAWAPVPEARGLATAARADAEEATWEVRDLAAGAAVLRDLAMELGGELDTASRPQLFALPGAMPVEVRVPAARGDELLERLRRLGVKGVPESPKEEDGRVGLLLTLTTARDAPGR